MWQEMKEMMGKLKEEIKKQGERIRGEMEELQELRRDYREQMER